MRNQRFKAFVGAVAPRAEDRVLDVGVSGQVGGSVNHFERVYPCVQRGIKFACADALALPFDDASFDIVYCNAVIEHVGSRARQGKLISELLRVGKRVFLATPDAASPMESHTLIPLAHWLPQKMCHAIYRLAGRGYFATEDNLNLLDVGQLLSLLPREIRHRTMIRRQYLMGMPAVITVTVGPKI